MLSLYEKKQSPETVRKIKIALFGPLAGIGDAIFWFTLMPIMSGICASLANEGNVLGPILYFLVFFAVFLLRVPLAHIGYGMGTKAFDIIQNNTQRVNQAATILGITILGGLIASYIHISLLPIVDIGNGNTISIQTDLIDKIIPNLLPLLFTFFILWLLRKKVKPTTLIIVTLIIAIGLSFFGIL